MTQKMIVAEVSKNWHEASVFNETPLNVLFEIVIERNLERGYKLHSWRLNRINDAKGILNETIIAVFEHQS